MYYPNVSAQFYGSSQGGADSGQAQQLVHVFSTETSPTPLELLLDGTVTPNSAPTVTLNGLTLIPEQDYKVVFSAGVSAVKILLGAESIYDGDVFIVSAQLMG